jgi:hypothetical protein
LKNTDIVKVMPSRDTKKPTVAWNLNSLVIGPIEVLQTLGIDVFADER